MASEKKKKAGLGKIKIKTAKKLRDEDFLYASAYIRSVENRGLSRAVVKRMLEAADAEEAETALFEGRATLPPDAKTDTAEAICDEYVNDSFRTAAEIVGDVHVFDFLRYQYDCNNIKTALKCEARGLDPSPLYFSCGSIPTDTVTRAVKTREYAELPGAFADAARDAADAYAKTGDPQSIDLPLDGASFEMTASGADKTGIKLFSDAVRVKIDLTNVVTAVRVIRMKSQTQSELLRRALCGGGSIDVDGIITAAEEGEETLSAYVKGRVPESFYSALTSADTMLSALERDADDAYLSFAAEAKKTVFGAAVIFGFLVEREYNAKNARIIIAGKRAGVPYDKLADRIRTV